MLKSSFGRSKVLHRAGDLQKRFDLVMFVLPSLPRDIESSVEMKDFDRVCIYVDNDFQAEDSFTVRDTEHFTSLSARWRHSPC